MIPLQYDLVRVSRACGEQYKFCPPFLFRVITAQEEMHSPDGSVWLTGYEIDAAGLAVEGGHHEIWIANHEGLDLVTPAVPRPAPATPRRPRNDRPARIPQQRTVRTTRSNR